MEDRMMSELKPEEMDKVFGGAIIGQECAVHVWMHMGPGSEGEIYQCRICGKIENRYEKKSIPDDRNSKPNPMPVPLN